jgi:signal transduction histidine kinase
MTQLFSNLLSNALKYTRSGSAPVVTIGCRQEGSQYHIDVTDNGIGFAQEHAEQIFSIFKRLHRKNEYGGTGIGLAMCKKIVENHHGQIFARSQPGQGATFHLVLPVRDEQIQ